MKSSAKGLLVMAVVFTFSMLMQPGYMHAQETVLKAAGCKTEVFLLKDVVEAYKVKTGNKVQLGNTGNKKAVNLLLDQKIDFTFTCKPIKKLTKGLKLDPASVLSWRSIAIAKDPIVIVSNVKNGVQSITSEQLTNLFQGKIANWKELGGNDLPIETAYMSSSLESGVVLLFKEFTVGNKGKLDENAMIANGPSMLGNFVSVTPGSVTFMGFNSYREKYGDIVEIDGVAPTRENILNGSYGLAATYYLTLDGRNSESVTGFVEFVHSEEGKKSIDQNFISVSQ
jgi:phosphate transport system substrate-binding protein